MRVLALRPENAARRTAARLAALGHEAICAPVLEIHATDEPAPSGPFDAVIATSAQAFRFADAASLRPLIHLPLMCVGARTAAAARAAGFLNVVVETPDAARLVERMKDHMRAPKRLLYLVARDRKPVLETGLAAAGLIVAPWTVYEARAVSSLPGEAVEALREGTVDAALHFSPRSAAIFCKLVANASLQDASLADASLADAARKLLHVAISADAARELQCMPIVRVAAEPDEAHMLELL